MKALRAGWVCNLRADETGQAKRKVHNRFRLVHWEKGKERRPVSLVCRFETLFVFHEGWST